MREVAGRPFDLQRHHRKLGSGDAGELVDRRAAGGEIRHHLVRHLGREGRHALRGDAVRSGEHHHLHLVELRHGAALPARQPGGDLLETPEAALRLGQRVLAGERGLGRRLVAGPEVRAGRQ